MSKKEEFKGSNEIRVLPYPDCFRDKIGVYLGGNQDFSQSLLEILSNSFDESYANPECNSIIVDQNWGGSSLNLVADAGRGLPIEMSKDFPEKTQALVSLTSIHSGTKFYSTGNIKTGTNGLGAKAVCATSQNYILLSKITENNYDKSIPEVKTTWEKAGPRQKKDLYYYLVFEKGHLQVEGAGSIKDIEKIIFSKYPSSAPLPSGYSTIVLFNADPEIYEKTTSKLPIRNLEYFSLIQEKIYGRKTQLIVNGKNFRDNFEPYQFEFVKTIIPADPSKNPQLICYVNFEVDEDLEVRESTGSINGLENDGVHVKFIEQSFEAALKTEYKVSHKYTLNGLRLNCIVIADSVTYDSQTKVRVRQIDKVKVSDFEPIAKEFIKIFRKNPDIFQAHVDRLDQYALSQKAFGAKEKSLRMISSGRGVGFYKSRAEVPRGFADATNPNRLETELYLCFPADQEILLVGDGGEYNLSFEQLSEQFKLPAEEQGDFYTYATTSTGKSRRTKIIACKEIKKTWEIVKVTLSDGTNFRCTPDHKVRLEGGEYKEAGSLLANDRVMMREGEGKSGVTPSIILWENHKEPIPVYCLEVQDKEHNFSLDNGVVVKNCEGVSSASGLVNGRKDTKTAAILPLRGKVMNVSDKDESAALDNKEINAIFKLVGLGTSSGNVFEGCKTQEEVKKALQKHAGYGKIIIATDADSDGLAIRNALVYAFARLGKFLIDLNMLYYANSPIFEQDGNFYYPDDPFTSDGFPVGLDPSRHFRRFKGLTEKV